MKKLLVTIALAMIFVLPITAQTYYTPTEDVEVIYTTIANLETAEWAVDINGEKNYEEKTGKYVSINPETDAEEEIKFSGIYIKEINSNAGRSIIFYITGITEFKAYAGDKSATSGGRYVEVAYNAEGEDAVELQGTNTNYSSILAIPGLDPSKKYKFHVNANNKDLALHAIKLTKGAGVTVVPELLSVVPQEDATDVELEQAVRFTYNVEVKAPTVTINGETIEPVTDGNKTFTIPCTLEYSTTYTIIVGETTSLENEDVAIAGKTWSFTTMAEPVCPVEFTTEAKTWETPITTGNATVDNTLYICNIDEANENNGFKLLPRKNGTYIMFALPAGVSGKLTFMAKSSGTDARELYYYATNDWQDVPAADNAGVKFADVPNVFAEYGFDISTTEDTYIFVYNAGGNTWYKDFSWTPVIDALIQSEKVYYLNPQSEEWQQEGWVAANFINQNTGASAWVRGQLLDSGYYLFYLSQYNVPAAAPARAVAEEMPVYTHVNFVFLSNETTEMTTEGALQSTGNVYYDDINYLCYNTLSEEWEYLASALDEVKSGSFAYRNNVVCANGNIEVYDVNGIMVARGVDNVDLTAVAKGAYIVRCGDAVVKIMR